jgi:hypothetical protein
MGRRDGLCTKAVPLLPVKIGSLTDPLPASGSPGGAEDGFALHRHACRVTGLDP